MIYRFAFRHLFVRLDPERAHRLAMRVLGGLARMSFVRGPLRRLLAPRDKRLRVGTLGLDLRSPLGVAAGVDKDATWFTALDMLGFGFCEVGTVTAEPQPGNEGLRVLRLPTERALVNRMGFPSPGAAKVASNLSRRDAHTILGVNIGKTKRAPLADAPADYAASVNVLTPFADYVVLNVSSPNTPGLRDMQAFDVLTALVSAARAVTAADARRVPLLLKVGPDLSDDAIDAIADLAVSLELDGIVSVNTTIDSACLRSADNVAAAQGAGGISGPPVRDQALHFVRRLYERAGDKLVLISVGGIDTPEDAWERVLAGATLVQAYTGFVYGGPFWPMRMNRGLARIAREAGVNSIQAMVGAATARGPRPGLNAAPKPSISGQACSSPPRDSQSAILGVAAEQSRECSAGDSRG